jgi:hypothetical protein
MFSALNKEEETEEKKRESCQIGVHGAGAWHRAMISKGRDRQIYAHDAGAQPVSIN